MGRTVTEGSAQPSVMGAARPVQLRLPMHPLPHLAGVTDGCEGRLPDGLGLNRPSRKWLEMRQ